MKDDTVDFLELIVGKHRYYVRILTKYNRSGKPYSHGFDFGGRMKGCVSITVEVPDADLLKDDRFKQFEESKKIADISWIGYNPKCSVSENLPSGEGTRHMIRTAMSFVSKKCAWIEKFSLTDASKVPCKEGMKVSLSRISIVTNGKTYYEKYFGAYLQSEHAREEYSRGIAKLNAPSEKLPLDRFCDLFHVPDDTKDIIGSIYADSKTYVEFFRRLKEHPLKGSKPFCLLIQPWGDAFVDAILDEKTNQYWVVKWLIDKDKITTVDVNNSRTIDDGVATKIRSVFQEEFKEYELKGGDSAVLGPGDLE